MIKTLRLAMCLVMLFASAAQSEDAEPSAIDVPQKSELKVGRAILFEVGDIYPPLVDSLKLVLRTAQDQDYDTIVFVIDSDGGLVSEADDFVDAMNDYPELQYVAYIKSAISAALWPVVASSYVYIEDGGTIGGAQMFYRDSSTGNYLVDGKFNSIKEARIRALIQKNHHPEAFALSMIIPQATGKKTTIEFEQWKPLLLQLEKTTMELDEARVSTYTSREAVDNGFAIGTTGLPNLFADAVGVNHAAVYGICSARHMARHLSDHVFTEVYSPTTMALLLTRKTKSVRKWRRTGVGTKETVPSTRWQNDHEYQLAQEKVKKKVHATIKQCDTLERVIDNFLNGDRCAILESDIDSKQRITTSFIAGVVLPKVKGLKSQIDKFEPMILDFYYDALVEDFNDIETLCEDQPSKR